MDVEEPLTAHLADGDWSRRPTASRANELAGLSPARAWPAALHRVWRAISLAALVLVAASALACGSGSDGTAPNVPWADAGGNTGDGATPPDKVCSKDGWCWDSPFPQGNTLTSVWAVSGSDAWFVGAKGTILHYLDGNWQAAVSPTTRDLYGIWGASGSDIWAVGASANVLHFDGKTWSLENGTAADPEPLDGGTDAGPEAAAGDAGPPGLPRSADLLGIGGGGPDDIWVVGFSGNIAHFDGTKWLAQEGVTTAKLRTVWEAPDGTVYVGGNGILLKYDGESWEKISTVAAGAWAAIHGTSEDDIWAVGSSSAIAHFDGTSWTQKTLPGGTTAHAVVADSPDSVWAFGEKGAACHWDGEAWSLVSTGTREMFYTSSRYAPGKFFVAGANGTIIKWENGARASLTQSFESNFLGITGTGGDDIWVAGDTVLHGTTAAWHEEAPPVNRSLYGIWAQDKDHVWAVGTAGTILGRSLIGWVVAQSPTEEWLRGVWAADSGAGWIVGDKGTILGLLNGASWAVVPSGTTADLYSVWGPAPAEAWAVGDKGTLLHWSNGAWQPSAIELGDAGTAFDGTLHAVWGSASSDVWSVGSLGAILHYNGSSWRPEPSLTQETLNAVWGRSATDVWAAGTAGTVLHYDGAAWTELDSGALVDLRAVWGTDQYTWVVGDRGAVLRRAAP